MWPFSAAFSCRGLFQPRLEPRGTAGLRQARKILDTFHALEAISRHVGGIPGRKNLLWISAGFPLVIGTPDTGGEDMTQMRTFGEEMNRAARYRQGYYASGDKAPETGAGQARLAPVLAASRRAGGPWRNWTPPEWNRGGWSDEIHLSLTPETPPWTGAAAGWRP